MSCVSRRCIGWSTLLPKFLRRAGDEVPADDDVGTELAIVFSTQTPRWESCIPVAASALEKIIAKGGGTIKRMTLVMLSAAVKADTAFHLLLEDAVNSRHLGATARKLRLQYLLISIDTILGPS